MSLDTDTVDWQRQLVQQGEFRKISRRYLAHFGTLPERDVVVRKVRRKITAGKWRRWCLGCASIPTAFLFLQALLSGETGVILFFGIPFLFVFIGFVHRFFRDTPKEWLNPKPESAFWSSHTRRLGNGKTKEEWTFDEERFVLHRLVALYGITDGELRQ